MTGARWQRWVLGGVVAGIIPIAVGGAGCSSQDDSPEASAGTPSTSGSTSGGSAGANTAGSATAGAAAGGSSGGSSAGTSDGGSGPGVAGNGGGGTSAAGANGNGGSGGASGECCTAGNVDVCSQDGQQLKRCALVPGKACNGSTSMYVSVWQVQACANGCSSGGGGGTSARCN